LLVAFGAVALALGVTAVSQPPGDKGPGGAGGGKMPIHVIPPFAVQDLKLTPDQERQLQELERDVRSKVMKILTPEQLRKLQQSRPPGFRGDDKGGPGGGKGGPGADRKEDKGKSERSQARPAAPPTPIAWFGRWQDAVRDAERTERPILFVSAAPHCSGVSGIW
jgi:Spy/CpxP family protein refolding chaperone